MGIEISLKK